MWASGPRKEPTGIRTKSSSVYLQYVIDTGSTDPNVKDAWQQSGRPVSSPQIPFCYPLKPTATGLVGSPLRALFPKMEMKQNWPHAESSRRTSQRGQLLLTCVTALEGTWLVLFGCRPIDGSFAIAVSVLCAAIIPQVVIPTISSKMSRYDAFTSA